MEFIGTDIHNNPSTITVIMLDYPPFAFLPFFISTCSIFYVPSPCPRHCRLLCARDFSPDCWLARRDLIRREMFAFRGWAASRGKFCEAGMRCVHWQQVWVVYTGSSFSHGSAKTIWIQPHNCPQQLILPSVASNACHTKPWTSPETSVKKGFLQVKVSFLVRVCLFLISGCADRTEPFDCLTCCAALHLNLYSQLGRFGFPPFNVTTTVKRGKIVPSKINSINAQAAMIKCLIRLD